MKTVDSYIGSRFLQGFALIIVILAALFSFLELVSQLDDVGRGNYELKDALFFIGLTLPRRLLDLMPISTLLGSIVALGLLADHGELLAMQAGGMSVRRICLSVLASGTLLIISTGMLAEMVVPPMDQLARTRRAMALSSSGVTLTQQGFWARRGFSYIHVGKTLSGGVATDVDIFESDEKGRLRVFTYAREADIQDNRRWLLKDITQKNITDQSITTRHMESLTLDSFLSSDQVDILELPAISMSSFDLHRYVRALRGSGQNADRYALALWRKLSVPLTTGAMILLSLPFIFGSTRRTTAGRRIMLGAFVGIALYFIDQVTMHLGLLLSLNPIITAMTPVVLIAGIALWRLRRNL
ncbi:MAG: LPS export ABC transporter permease LptG [Desulfobacterales bacterium]|nr:LPS export ABC transporter permease LptG [Desulfobacterales bacterium]